MRMRIPEHRIVVLLGITLLMVSGCATFPGRLMEWKRTSPDSPAAARHPLIEGEACRMLEKVVSILRKPVLFADFGHRVVLGVTIAVVTLRSLPAATMNLVKSLRNE